MQKQNLKARVFIGANAYALIEHAGLSMDVLLTPGRSASASLRESAAEWREQSARLLARASLVETAAEILADGSTNNAK